MLRKLNKRTKFGLTLSGAIFFFVSLTARAAPIDIYEFSVFMNATELGATSVGETQIANGFTGLSEFAGAGLGFSFMNNLGANNAGTLTWSISNNTGSNLSNVWLFGFLDADIDEPVNSFFNETGSVANFTAGSGSADAQADSWEVDEPGFVFGDIYGNVQAGALDNSNGIASSDDVSLALGFNVGDLLMDETLSATFEISLTDNGGLLHFDPDSQFDYYYNGSVSRVVAAVPGPSTLILLMFGLLFMVVRAVASSGQNLEIS